MYFIYRIKVQHVTAHSGLAHLAQLTTIYMRGLLGAKYLLTYNQVRNMVTEQVRVRAGS
jgi:hypothetical protein